MITVAGDSAGTFETADTVRAGAYVYSLTQNGKNWYLTSLLSPEPTPLTPDTTDITRHAVRPRDGEFRDQSLRREHDVRDETLGPFG